MCCARTPSGGIRIRTLRKPASVSTVSRIVVEKAQIVISTNAVTIIKRSRRRRTRNGASDKEELVEFSKKKNELTPLRWMNPLE